MNINWNDMRYFLTLSRANSFIAAADLLMVTHTTVSRRISGMEETLQTQLFHRTERGCQLTPAGEKLLPYAEQLESTMMSVQESIAGYNNQLAGAIRIGAPDGIGNSYLAERLGEMQRAHPHLEIELIAAPIYYSLSKREIDILITVRKPTAGNVILRKLVDYKLGLFATREYLEQTPPITHRSDLTQHKIVGYIDDLLFDKDLQFMDEIVPGLKPSFRSSTVITQLNAVRAGAGIGVIPYFMAHNKDELCPVLPNICIERKYWLQVNPDSKHMARVRTTIDFLLNQTKKDDLLFNAAPWEKR